jgi:ubiquinone biosynthesis protein
LVRSGYNDLRLPYFAKNARRLLGLARVLAVHAVAQLLQRYAGWWPWLVRRSTLAQMPGPQRLQRLLEDLGGSFIKFGQMLALQPDILPIEYCNALFNLLDRIAPFPFAEVERVFVEELGRTPAQLFDDIDTTPLSTASIGQVHVAHLGGRKLAVKVQRPSVDVEFAGDIRLIRFAMRVIRGLRIRSMFWALEPMDEFAAWTVEELDYRREARYADRLRRNAADNPVERIPAVLWDLTTRRTLVMEFMPGITALQYLRDLEAAPVPATGARRRPEFDRDRFARHIIRNFVGDVFRHGVFHADLHPANLLVLPGEVVGYVDFGITGVLSGYTRRYLVAMTLACTRGDIDTMANEFFRLATSTSASDPALFRSSLAAAAQEWYESNGAETVLKKNFTLVMLDMLIICRKAGMLPERDVVKYIRSAVAADGLITRLSPGFNVARCLEEACQELVMWELQRRLQSPDAIATVIESSRHLIENGAARATAVLRRLAEGDVSAVLDITTGVDRDARLRRQTLRLAGVVVALTALLELTGGPARLGVNIVTAEAMLAGAALVALLNSIRRLVRV